MSLRYFRRKERRSLRKYAGIRMESRRIRKEGLFTFLEYTPEKVKVMLEEGGGSIETLVVKKQNCAHRNRQHYFIRTFV